MLSLRLTIIIWMALSAAQPTEELQKSNPDGILDSLDKIFEYL
ncbi:MAG: hypothetical protein AAF518_25660 [Spirochaetota bacterium]